MADKDANKERDERGRFAPGNPGGPGGARRRASELRRAAEEAVTPEIIAAMVRKAARLGLEGNLTAMRLVFDRTCGRAAEAPAEGVAAEVALPQLRSVADCNQALDRVIAGVLDGSVDRELGKLLIAAVQTRLRGIEANELEARLVELEQAARHVDTNKRRNGRY